jgi:SAM-dependent methyltransferase
MTQPRLEPTRCAICGTEGNAAQIYAARLGAESFSAAVFSARRLPDGVHYRVVRCRSCGLVRSDPTVDPEEIARIYSQSVFEYDDEVRNLNATYGKYLRSLARFGAGSGSLLEIGCGNGFFLEEALRQGYVDVRGVEPSAEAIARADPAIRPRIQAGVVRNGLLDAGRFDVVCMFQVLDHLPDPAAVLEECHSALKPGGLILCLNHNVNAVSARLLGRHSPIIDVEHTYLFSLLTLRRIFELRGFQVVSVRAAWNRCSLRYLLHLIPMPGSLKRGLLALLAKGPLGRVSLTLPLGNAVLIARKAEGTGASAGAP